MTSSAEDLLATSKAPPALKWDGKALQILDQRYIPQIENYIPARSAETVIEAIRTLAVRGAPNIGVAGACALSMALNSRPGKPTAKKYADYIISTRPTAVNLQWAVRRVEASALSTLTGRPDFTAASKMALAARIEADNILTQETRNSQSMAIHGCSLFAQRDHKNFMTICNTGNLAAPGLGTALGTIILRASEYPGTFVYPLETRPLLQGLRLTAWELSYHKVPHAVVVDGAAATLLANGNVDAVVVGADRIAQNGDFANKIGTRSLAELARAFDVPFYVVAPTSTIDHDLPTGDLIPIESRSGLELTRTIDGRPIADGAKVANPAFDVTPFYLVDHYITEHGASKSI